MFLVQFQFVKSKLVSVSVHQAFVYSAYGSGAGACFTGYLGIVLSLLANIPNIILVTVYALTTFSGADQAKGIVGLISCFANGMYWGTMIVFKLQGFWVSFLIAIIPAVVASGLAYFLGHKNFKFFGFITNKKPTVSNERPNMK